MGKNNFVSEEDLKNLEEIIRKQKAPIYFETPYGKFAFVLSEEAKAFVANKGFIPIQIKELKEWLKDCKTYEEQKEVIQRKQKELADFCKTVFTTKNLFEGNIKSVRLSSKRRR